MVSWSFEDHPDGPWDRFWQQWLSVPTTSAKERTTLRYFFGSTSKMFASNCFYQLAHPAKGMYWVIGSWAKRISLPAPGVCPMPSWLDRWRSTSWCRVVEGSKQMYGNIAIYRYMLYSNMWFIWGLSQVWWNEQVDVTVQKSWLKLIHSPWWFFYQLSEMHLGTFLMPFTEAQVNIDDVSIKQGGSKFYHSNDLSNAPKGLPWSVTKSCSPALRAPAVERSGSARRDRCGSQRRSTQPEKRLHDLYWIEIFVQERPTRTLMIRFGTRMAVVYFCLSSFELWLWLYP